jgi:hypothetical protein
VVPPGPQLFGQMYAGTLGDDALPKMFVGTGWPALM